MIALHEILAGLGACTEAVKWSVPYGTDYERAWAECPRGDWLLWIAGRVGVDRRLVVLAACDCARLALRHVPEGETRPLAAIETAERWARGEAALDEVRAAYAAADAAYADAHTETLRQCADLVRARIPLAAVLSALTTREEG